MFAIKRRGLMVATSVIIGMAATSAAEVLPDKPDLRAVSVYRDHAAAVGRDGAVYLYTPKTGWAKQRVPLHKDFADVALTRRHVWVVGQGGEALYFDGQQWFALPGSDAGAYHGVFAEGPRKGAAVGQGGFIAYLAQDRWQRFYASPTKRTLRALAPVGRGRSERFIAVGEGGTVVALRGVARGPAAELEPSGVSADLTAIAGCTRSRRSEAVATGDNVAVLRSAEGTWQPLTRAPEALSAMVVTCRRGTITRVIGAGAKGLWILDRDQSADSAARSWRLHALEQGRARDLAWYRRDTLLVVGDAGFVAFMPAAAFEPEPSE